MSQENQQTTPEANFFSEKQRPTLKNFTNSDESQTMPWLSLILFSVLAILISFAIFMGFQILALKQEIEIQSTIISPEVEPTPFPAYSPPPKPKITSSPPSTEPTSGFGHLLSPDSEASPSPISPTL